MDMSFEDQIRERAYHIWMAGGMTDGQAHEHWVSAEQAVRNEVVAEPAKPVAVLFKPVSAKAAAKPAKAAAKAAKSTAPKTRRPAKAKKADLHAAH